MTQSAPSATLNDVFTAAVATYGGDDAPKLGSQWTALPMDDISRFDPTLSGAMQTTGFSGQVNVNLQTGEIIIADRGTANLKNVATDAGVAVDTVADSHLVAEAFARAGLAAARKQLAQAGVEMSAVYTTGHSLGGAESEMQAGMLSLAADSSGVPLVPAGVPITNVSLDAPGIAGLANRGDRERYTSYNFSSQGDVVHLSGGSDLKGTADVSLPVGPQMWSTAGLIAGGAAATIAVPGMGALAGGIMLTDGLANAAAAHKSMLMFSGAADTALGRIPMTQFSEGLSPTQLQALFQVSPTQYKAVADAAEVAAASAGYAPTSSGMSSFSLFGLDANGKIDPALADCNSSHTAAAVDGWMETSGYSQRPQPQPKVSL